MLHAGKELDVAHKEGYIFCLKALDTKLSSECACRSSAAATVCVLTSTDDAVRMQHPEVGIPVRFLSFSSHECKKSVPMASYSLPFIAGVFTVPMLYAALYVLYVLLNPNGLLYTSVFLC